jgi:hypothetical protein
LDPAPAPKDGVLSGITGKAMPPIPPIPPIAEFPFMLLESAPELYPPVSIVEVGESMLIGMLKLPLRLGVSGAGVINGA